MKNTFKFDYGDSVLIRNDAPDKYKPNNRASICGMRAAENEQTAKEFGIKLYHKIYTVEFGDGSSIEIPEIYLIEDSPSDNI